MGRRREPARLLATGSCASRRRPKKGKKMKKLLALGALFSLLVASVAFANATSVNVFAGKDGRWYFNVKAGNGKIVLQSQGYKQKQGAWVGANSIVRNGRYYGSYKVGPSKDGQF